MRLLQRLRKDKLKKRTDTEAPSLAPTASVVVSSSTSIEALRAVEPDENDEDYAIATTETLTTKSANDEQLQAQQAARRGPTRGSKTDKWLARVTLFLGLSKNAADAGGLAPLKGACEGMVTLLGSI